MSSPRKRWIISGIFMLFFASLLLSCKPKCYDCIVTNPDTMQPDTINTICTDQPQYTGSYFESWKVVCTSGGGQTVVREED